MSNFKYLTFLISFLVFQHEAIASQVAIVVTKNAVVYAHPDLTGPLGTVSKGKKLHASESIVSNGRALPFQLGNKVAFISLDDVITENAHHIPLGKTQSEDIEHEVVNHFESKHENNFTKDNYFVFETGRTMFLKGDWVKFNQFIRGSDPELAHDYSIYVQHRPSNLRHYIAVGVNYIYQRSDQIEFSVPILVGDIFISPIKNDILSIDLGMSVFASGDLQIKVGTPKKRFVGTLLGAGPKLNIRFLPNKLIGFHLSARYQYNKLLNLEDLEIPGVGTNITLNETNNASILLGISIQVM